jgi:hypothetical protein
VTTESSVNESVFRRSIEAWNAGDWQTLGSRWEEGGEIVAPEGWPESGVFRGWPAIREQFEHQYFLDREAASAAVRGDAEK